MNIQKSESVFRFQFYIFKTSSESLWYPYLVEDSSMYGTLKTPLLGSCDFIIHSLNYDEQHFSAMIEYTN